MCTHAYCLRSIIIIDIIDNNVGAGVRVQTRACQFLCLIELPLSSTMSDPSSTQPSAPAVTKEQEAAMQTVAPPPEVGQQPPPAYSPGPVAYVPGSVQPVAYVPGSAQPVTLVVRLNLPVSKFKVVCLNL